MTGVNQLRMADISYIHRRVEFVFLAVVIILPDHFYFRSCFLRSSRSCPSFFH
jgi:hypothetical protein